MSTAATPEETSPEIEGRRSIGARRNPHSAEAILEAAESVLLESGHSGFSIEAVARRARAGKPTIYRWWPSKAALLMDVYRRQKRDVAQPDTGSLEEDLFQLARSLFTLWRTTPAGPIFRSIIAEAQSDVRAAEALAAHGAERRLHSGRMVARAIARGEARADVDPKVVVDLVSSYGWTHLLTDRLDEDDDTLRAAIACIVRGVLA
jgi:AcrR family transcriptional regulator